MANINTIVTDAGIQALINAERTGTEKVGLTTIKFSDKAIAATSATTDIGDVVAELTTVAGAVTSDHTIQVTSIDSSDNAYKVRTFGVYTDSGILFAVASSAEPILEKVQISQALFAVDIYLSNGNPEVIEFGDVGFINPSATTMIEGSVRLATDDEAREHTEENAVLTPSNIPAFMPSWLDEVIPAGTVLAIATSNIPEGFLLCNGAAVSRTDYARLFEAIGTIYGAGDGETTFNLPDLRDRFIEGAGSNALGTYLEAGLPNITGNINNGNYCFDAAGTNGVFKAISGKSGSTPNIGSSNIWDIGFDASRSNDIYGSSTTVQPASLNINILIKY